MVPTLWVAALLTGDITVGKQQFKAGEMVRLPYGVAIQLMAIGGVTAISDADAMHAQATEMLGKFGPDSWFPQPVQTIGKLSDWMSDQLRERGAIPNVPRNAAGDTIH